MRKSRVICVLLCAVMCIFAFTACGNSSSGSSAAKNNNSGISSAVTDNSGSSEAEAKTNSLGETIKQYDKSELLSGKHTVKMDIKDRGTVTIELDADQAPITVTNFVDLAKQGYYDGLTFHRIIKGQFAQGGDPAGNGTGGPGYAIKGEFKANGVDNTLSHTRGAISMARTSDNNGGGSQFFIMDADYKDFDGQYACFGYVTDGMDVIDDICKNTEAEDENGTVAKENQPVISSVKVVD